MDKTIVFFDTETGGLEDHHPTIQIAAVAVRNWEEIDVFECKIQFDREKCQARALELNSFDPEVWADKAVSLDESIDLFVRFLNRHKAVTKISKNLSPYQVAQLGGYNICHFDYPRLQREFTRRGLFMPAHFCGIDTMQLASLKFFREIDGTMPSLRLVDLCERFGISVNDAHDALADARMSAALAKVLLS